MKATGVVRRIDDLGRVVIPKEIMLKLYLRQLDILLVLLIKILLLLFPVVLKRNFWNKMLALNWNN